MPQQTRDGFKVDKEGDRVVGGTRRADGTVRPVRKIREGYMPPDEQQAYMSRGRQRRQDAEKEGPPGFYSDDDGPAAGAKSQSKSAKKNAARKAKKAVQPVAAPTEQPAQRHTGARAQAQAPAQQPCANTVDIAAADALAGRLDSVGLPAGKQEQAASNDPDAKRRRLRNLRKKVRQIQEQVQKAAATGQGQPAELEAKIANLPALQSEIAALAAEVEG